MNKKASFVGIFLFMIVALILVITSAIFIYVGQTTLTGLHNTMDNMSTATTNYTVIINQTMGKVPLAYEVLKWGSVVLIIAMILSIFISSYMVTTKPIYFVPYIVFCFAAIVISVVMANAYYDLLQKNNALSSVLASFVGANFLLLNLPVIVSVVAVVGGMIMFASYKFASQDTGGVYYG